MNFRLARPVSLIDINRIEALDYVREEEGELRIGAFTRHSRFERPVTGGALARLLPRVCAAHRACSNSLSRNFLRKRGLCRSCVRMVLADGHS